MWLALNENLDQKNPMKKLVARKLARPIDAFRAFLDSSAAGGIILMVAAALALIVANSALASTYADTLHLRIGPLPVLEWINDALMALFFLLVGLEIKKEVLTGQLSTWSQRALPGIAALGGMIVPALIFLALNFGATGHPKGWAIPSATDIAFTLGVLSLLGPRVPSSLRVFLTALAIIDDLGAVLIIAFFYTGGLNLLALAGAAVVLAGLIALNRTGVVRLLPYLILGATLWVLTFMSGIHATLAGVALAFTIPLSAPRAGEVSFDPGGARFATMGQLRDRTAVRVRQRWGVVCGAVASRFPRHSAARRSPGAILRETGGCIRVLGDRDPRGLGQTPRPRKLAPALCGGAIVWHRVHHEPFYGSPCVPR